MRWHLPLLGLLSLAGLALPFVTPYLAGASGTWVWLIDLASHWQLLYLLGLVAAAGGLMRHSKYWLVAVLAVPLPWLTAGLPSTDTPGDTPGLQVLSANVGFGNDRPDRLLELLRDRHFDVVALVEVSPAYAAALASLPEFAHRHLAPADTPFGIGLLSRHPLTDIALSRDDDGVPRLHVTMLWRGQRVNLAVVHPMPPISPHFHAARDAYLAAASSAARDAGRPAILMGDLNATPWSTGARAVSAGGLRRASGLLPTWPVPFARLFGIPIDQVYVSAHWTVAGQGRAADIGSDHLPVWVGLRLQQQGDQPVVGR